MYSASIENNGNRQYRASTKGYGFLMGQEGANPIDVLLASLCACVGHHFRDHMVAQTWVFSLMTVTANAELAADKLALARIAVSVDVQGAQMTEAQKSELLRQASRCPIYNSLSKGADITVSFG